MLRIDLAKTKPGSVLAMPIHHPRQPGQVLLKSGYELTPQDIQRLDDLGIEKIWIRHRGFNRLSKVVNAEVIATQGQIERQVSDTVDRIKKKADAHLPHKALRQAVWDMVSQLIRHPQAAMFLGDLNEADADNLIPHSSSVAHLSLLMGLKLEGYLVQQRRHVGSMQAKQVINLGVGSILHDIGITQLPEDVRQRYHQTGNDQDPPWREHPALGFSMVRGQIDPTAAAVVANHHQRFDGSGYAGKGIPILEGERIHIYARITGLAEQFNRMRHPPNGAKVPTFRVLAMLLQDDMVKKFDPHVMRAMLEVVPPYPPGSLLRLSDQRWAVCLDHVPTQPTRPIVQTVEDPDQLGSENASLGPTIDLSEHNHSLYITHCDGQDVGQVHMETHQPPT